MGLLNNVMVVGVNRFAICAIDEGEGAFRTRSLENMFELGLRQLLAVVQRDDQHVPKD